MAGGPGPLEVEPAAVAVDVQHFAGKEEPGGEARLEGPGGHGCDVHPAGGHLRVGPGVGPGDFEIPPLEHRGDRGDLDAEHALVGFINKRLIGPVLKIAGIPDPTLPAASLGEQGVLAVAATLQGWAFEVTGTDSFTDAQVTAGGVDVADISPETLESRLAPGLFFAGEVLDIDGDCGGFNLQWAWSSGHLAGLGAAARRP